jgi:hypothetical protein
MSSSVTTGTGRGPKSWPAGKPPRTWVARSTSSASAYLDAHSPQAKGRIERLWATLQDRLASELRLRASATRGAAGAYLPTFSRISIAALAHRRRLPAPSGAAVFRAGAGARRKPTAAATPCGLTLVIVETRDSRPLLRNVPEE